MKRYTILIVVFLLISISFSGCLNEESESKMKYYPELKKGDKWTVEQDSEDWSTITGTMEVVNEDATYEGKSAVKMTADFTMEDYENETVKLTDFSGSGTYYKTDTLNYERMELSGTYYYKQYDRSVEMTIITKTEIDTTGEAPEKIKVNDKWTITKTKEETTIYKSGGEKLGEETETTIKTKNYEAVKKTETTVNAGTFTTMKIEWDQKDGESYGTKYYSEKVKRPVKEIKHTDEGDETIELISYELGQ